MHGRPTTHRLHPARVFDDESRRITIVREPDAWVLLYEYDEGIEHPDGLRVPVSCTAEMIDLLDRTGASTPIFERLPESFGIDGSVHAHHATGVVEIVVATPDAPRSARMPSAASASGSGTWSASIGMGVWSASIGCVQRIVDDLLLHVREGIPWGVDMATPSPTRALPQHLFGPRAGLDES